MNNNNINKKFPINPGEKLMESIKDARNTLDLLKGEVLKGQVSESFLREIRYINKKAPNNNEILQTLRLQLEQSLRERRQLSIELALLKKQNPYNGLDLGSLQKNIREIIENELKSKKNADASLSSSFNYNFM